MRSISRVARRVDQHRLQAAGGCGEGLRAFHDAKVRDVKARRVQVDEIWSFTYAKQKNVADHESGRIDGAGDTWTWTASRPIPS